MTAVVVDTNVILAANGQHQDLSPNGVRQCSDRILSVIKGHRVCIDDGFEIIKEYGNKICSKKQPGIGYQFYKWVVQNRSNENIISAVVLVRHQTRGYESFPDDPELANFDPPDRKFVAVAALHASNPIILQATDSKWLGWDGALKRHGVQVEFVCPVDIERFRQNKLGK
ncbi:MAG: hypothetical protein HQL41_07725 [Alphaproteobacteria bacterium]|nr:hypothetical protein [Alphaproteobacteria bacterium]